MRFRRHFQLAGAIVLLVLHGCASYDGSGLVPGQSTAADVERIMGQPKEKITEHTGETVWFYPHNPAGRDTYAVRVARDGRVVDIEQRLTINNIGRLVAGTSTREDVRLIFGPPYRVTFLPIQVREVWEYRMFNQIQIPHNLFVQYSTDGIVREVLLLRDPSQDMPAPFR
jgi:hypothetical protein